MSDFKVGDFIVNTTHSKPEPMIVTQAMIEDTSPHNHGSHLELWKPKEDEWCWFWDIGGGLPVLRKLTRIDKHVYPYCANYERYEHCEPFIGTLPSFIKENLDVYIS